jgi:hypothetical protein
MAGAFLVGHSRDSEGWFCGILGQISFGRSLSKMVEANKKGGC